MSTALRTSASKKYCNNIAVILVVLTTARGRTSNSAERSCVCVVLRFFASLKMNTVREVVMLSPQSLRASSSCQSGAVCSAARLSLRDDTNNRCVFWLVEGVIVTLRRILIVVVGYERVAGY